MLSLKKTIVVLGLAGAQAAKKSGIPAPREIPSALTKGRTSLRDQPRTSSTKKIVSSASTSSLSALAKQTRCPTKSQDTEGLERGLLECQIKELLAEAKAKDLEISNLRAELQHFMVKPSTPSASAPSKCVTDEEQRQVDEALLLVGELREKNGKFQKELAVLREDNQILKGKLLSLEAYIPSTTSKTFVNGLPSDSTSSTQQQYSSLRTSVSSSSDTTKDSPSPDSSEFEKIPSCSESLHSGASGESGSIGAVMSSMGQNLSVQSLAEQIHKMEENQHSNAEELQATLQELADQQQMVQELTAENEGLAKEKRLLQTSLQQQRECVEVLAQKNESLASRLQEQFQAQTQREEEICSQGPRLAELEQKYANLMESSHFEREKLVDIQQQLTGSLRSLEEEHHIAQGQVCYLREEMDRLQAQLDQELESVGQATLVAEEQRAAAESLRLENSRLKVQVDIERQMIGELKTMQNASDTTEVQSMLKAAHAERDQMEAELRTLREKLLHAQAETEHTRAALSMVGGTVLQLRTGLTEFVTKLLIMAHRLIFRIDVKVLK